MEVHDPLNVLDVGQLVGERRARVLDDVRNLHTGSGAVQFGLKHRRKLRSLRRARKNNVLATVRTAFGRARRFGIRQVLHQQFGARALRRHPRRAHR